MIQVVADTKFSKLEQILLQPTFKGTPNHIFFDRLSKKLAGRESVSGAELMVYSLEALAPENLGISNIAGHHGGAILPFYEVFTKSPLWEGYVHVPHEQIAGHMAEGVAYLHKVGVTVATSGPGGTNLVTAGADAYMDTKQMVYITGNVSQLVRDSMAFQENDIIAMVRKIAKKAFYVAKANDIPSIFYEAFATAPSGRPGLVWIDVPKDVQLAKIKSSEIQFNFEEPQPDSTNLGDVVNGILTLAEIIPSSRRPVLYVGAGARHAWKELREFAFKLGIPVTTTLKGKGMVQEVHLLSLGMLGMHGTAYANYVVDEADLVIAAGARFDDRVTGNPKRFAQNAYIAHIDIDPRGIGPNGTRQPQLTIKCDTQKVLRSLKSLGIEGNDLSGWHSRIEELRQKFPLDYDGRAELFKPRSKVHQAIDYIATLPLINNLVSHQLLKPQYVIERINELTEGNRVLVADVGQHQMWAAQWIKTETPYQFDTSGGSGTMGYSMPAALGIHNLLRHQGSRDRVFVVVGDESFMQTPHTLDLYARLQADIKVFVIDNKATDGTPGGMVRQWYTLVHNNTQYPVKDARDIARIARGFGVPAEAVKYANQVDAAIRRALNTKGPYLVHFKVDPYEDCLPMIPSGTSVEKMLTYQGSKAQKH